MSEYDSTDQLERDLSEVARALFAPGSVAGALQLTVNLAVATIDGCDAAGIFVIRDDRVISAAASDSIVVELDELQFATNEGPCLDAVSQGGSSYAADLADDPRWPRFGPAAAHAGIRSVLAYRLSDQPVSALNLYARLPAAFGTTDRAKGLIFATLAGLALDAAEERADDEQRYANLHDALRTRELIGQAQGILIERERITGDQAFDVLRRASQHLNIKLREVARTLVETGETPASGTPPPSILP
ncbi:MAG: GAF and ANTAR domain-containing protein [Ilumatobacteraceae bacterium]